jgi:hypothetical protein
LEEQRRALGLSAEAVERRVAALEQDADRTKAASTAYREWARSDRQGSPGALICGVLLL